MRHRAIISALLCLVLLPASAAAFPPSNQETNVTFNPAVQEAIGLAMRFWNYRTPDCPKEGILVTEGVPSYPGGAWAEAEQPGCHIDLSAEVYEGLQLENDSPSLMFAACKTVAHEYGHLLGEGHSTDPNSVMYPQAYVGNPIAVDPLCVEWAKGREQERLRDEEVKGEEEWREEERKAKIARKHNKTARRHVIRSRRHQQHTHQRTSTPRQSV